MFLMPRRSLFGVEVCFRSDCCLFCLLNLECRSTFELGENMIEDIRYSAVYYKVVWMLRFPEFC